MKIYFLAASVAVAGLVSFGVSQPAQALTASVAVDDAITVPTTSTGFQAPDFGSGTVLPAIGDNFSSCPCYRSPWEGTPQAGLEYTSVEANGVAGYNTPGPSTSLSLFWGSPDAYNNLTFYTGLNGTGIASNVLTGADLSGGDSGLGHHLVLILTDATFQSFTIGSNGSDAFEFANLATPIPPALPLFATGLGALGLLGRKKKKAASV